MMRKLLLTAVVAAFALSLTAGAAGAATALTASNATTLTLTNLRISGSLGIDIACNVTIDLAFHRSIAKRAGTLAGFADIAISTGRCSEGNMGLLVGGAKVTGPQGPYHITFVRFEGTLPSITGATVQVNDFAFWFSLGTLLCLTNGPIDIAFSSTGGRTATGMNVSAQNIPVTGGFLCGLSSITMSGAGTLSPSVTIGLI